MVGIIKTMEPKYFLPSLQLVETVFTEWDSPEEGKTVRSLVEEIRAKKYYIPELELIMVDEAGPNLNLPHPDCLMVKELDAGALEHIKGLVDYSFYEALHEG